MPESTYSIAEIHLPENKNLLRYLKTLSFLACLLVVVICALVLFGWLINLPVLKSALLGSITISPIIVLAFLFGSFSVLLEEKWGLFQKENKATKTVSRINYLVSVVFACVVFLLGLFFIFGSINNLNGGKNIFSNGLSFFMLGLALIIARLKLMHRFHVSQLLALIVLIINAIPVFGYIYQVFLPSSLNIIYLPLNTAIIFVFLCWAILLRWPARGFFGIFIIDSVSSKFVLRLLVINIAIIFLLGLLSLIGAQIGLYGLYDTVAIFATSIIIVAIILYWSNIKLLYRFELERFLMREELRVHNINLELDSKDLASKMQEVKKTNEEYLDKLNYKNKITEVIEGLS